MIYVVTSYDVHDPEMHSVEGVATSKEKLCGLLHKIVDPLLKKGFHLEESNGKEFLDVVRPSGGRIPDGISLIVHTYDDAARQPGGKETIRGVRQLLGL